MSNSADVADATDKAVYHRVCALDDIWAGEMAEYDVAGTKVLVVHTESGEVSAIQHMCPHQQVRLVEGALDGSVLTCSAHLWEVDVLTGKGVNPDHAEIARYPVKVEDDAVFVSIEGVKPKFAKP